MSSLVFFDPLTQKTIIDKTGKKTIKKIREEHRLSTETKVATFNKKIGYEIISNKLKTYNILERKKQQEEALQKENKNNVLCPTCKTHVKKGDFNTYYNGCTDCVNNSGRIGT